MSEQNSTETAPKNPKCVKGATGYVIVWQPGYKTIAYLDVKFNVSWDYTPIVTKKPKFVDAYVQSQKPGAKVDWETQVASQVPADQRWFWWKPQALSEGIYKLMIVPDGKKLAGVKADALPCFENGEAEPGISQVFSIMKLTNTQVPVTESSSDYGPSSSSLRLSPTSLPFALTLPPMCSSTGLCHLQVHAHVFLSMFIILFLFYK